jgi:hypothetical protein
MNAPVSIEDFRKTRVFSRSLENKYFYVYVGTLGLPEEEQVRIELCKDQFFLAIENMEYQSGKLEDLEIILWKWWNDLDVD